MQLVHQDQEQRRDSAEAYVKRLKDIEEIALGFEGVDKCFAIEAGRELRTYLLTRLLWMMTKHQF